MLLLSLLAVVIIAANNFSTLQAAAIIIFATGRLIEGVSDIFYGYSQKKDRLDIVAQSMIAKGIISLGLFYISFKLFSSLSISLLSMVVGWSIPLLFLDIPRNRKLMFKSLDYSAICYHINIPRFRSLFWLALPMGLTMFFIQLRNSIPRLILESGFGEQDLGVFAAMAYLILIGNTIVMALSQSSIARLSRYYILGNGEAFRALVIRLVLIGVCLGVVGVLIAMIAGQQLLSFMYGPDYAENIKVFIVVMLAGGLTYVGSFLGAPATAMRKFKPQLAIHSINAATMLGFGLFIIPKAGMIGAAWTMVVGACIMVIGYSVIVVKGFCSLGLYLKGKKGDLK
jgi:O-antigen/teichoic acid export membrane protein